MIWLRTEERRDCSLFGIKHHLGGILGVVVVLVLDAVVHVRDVVEGHLGHCGLLYGAELPSATSVWAM